MDNRAYLRKKNSGTEFCAIKIFYAILLLITIFVVGSSIWNNYKKPNVYVIEGSSVSTSNGYRHYAPVTTDKTNDDEYGESISRQRALEDMGLDNAANIERNSRLKYMQGNGYHSMDGKPQVQFQGSREQAEQLKMMNEMGW